MLVYKKWLLTFLKSFGQEIKKKKKKLRQNSATVWSRRIDYTQYEYTENTEKIPNQNPML